MIVRLTERAWAALAPGEVLLFDWQHDARCAPALGQLRLHAAGGSRVELPRFVRLADEPIPVYAHRHVAPHLAHRTVTVDCGRGFRGARRFACDLPVDFSLCLSTGSDPA